MAVLVEAISVIVRRDAIDARFCGGWREFLEAIPNRTFCADGELVRVGFMSPPDVEGFVRRLESGGLTFVRNGKAIDIAVVDQMCGPTVPAEWLEFARLPLGDTGGEVAACWLYEGPRFAGGPHMPAREMTIATPDGWTYEGSLSADFKFVGNAEMDEKLKFLRHEEGTDVYLDLSTGKEVYVGRTQSLTLKPDAGLELPIVASSVPTPHTTGSQVRKMTSRSTATSIDEYIAECPPETQQVLEELRALIKASAPGATETISYAIPTFDLNGKHLVHFAGYAKHIGFYPTGSGIQAFEKELEPYKRSKGSVQLPLGRPLPADLIRRIVEFRVEETTHKGSK
jgi:uncharacterized protein YdhG (YjbR/CyaY superfamily)